MMHKRIYSAVVDSHGEFIFQACRLVWSLINNLGIDRSNIILHVVGLNQLPSVPSALKILGVELVHIDPFIGHPYCNKLQQLASLNGRNFSDVVLLDCDIVVIEDFPKWDAGILAKPVDINNPPMDIIETIFKRAKLNIRLSKTDIDGLPTVYGNCNGGVYVVPKTYFSQLSEKWIYWADWCKKNSDVFKNYSKNIDQMSFAMALNSEKLPFRELERRYNFPTHLKLTNSFDCNPAALHYHRAVSVGDGRRLLLKVDGLDHVNAAIQKVNSDFTLEFDVLRSVIGDF